ncbi:MAG: alkaline phosphatase family protein [Nitrospirota bacterium]
MQYKPGQVIVIGIDGGTFDVIRPMADRGELPVLSSLMKKGSWGELESTIPPDTGPAWVSMMTGVNPGKHGIFYFLDQLHNNGRNGRPLGSADIHFPPLWSVLSREKKKVIFVNVPFTYPPVTVHGIMISGMFIPESAKEMSYPPEIYDHVRAKLNGFDINDWSPEVIGADRSNVHLHYERILSNISVITEKRKKATLMLLEENPWDFLMVVFTAIDRLQHLFWKFMDGSPSTPYGSAIQQGYRQIDNAVGEILDKAGPDTTVLIVSDHGFGPLEKYFYANKWLEEIGLLKVKSGSRKKLNFRMTNVHRVITKLVGDIPGLQWTKGIPFPFVRISDRDAYEMIDWQRTKAYADPCGGININLRGREPQGIVEQGKEADELIAMIKSRFSELTVESENALPKSGDWILSKEEIYEGPFAGEAADLYYSLNQRSYLHKTKIGAESKFGTSSLGSGMHRDHGIFIMNGPHCVAKGHLKPRMIDIAPTILYLMGLPVMREMDGQVLEEGITPEYLKANPLRHIQADEYRAQGASCSSEDEEKIRDSLKGLGYL